MCFVWVGVLGVVGDVVCLGMMFDLDDRKFYDVVIVGVGFVGLGISFRLLFVLLILCCVVLVRLNWLFVWV